MNLGISDLRCCSLVAAVIFMEITTGFALKIISDGQKVTWYEGSNVTLDCKVAAERFHYFFNQIIWYKTFPDGREVQVNTGAVVNEPFNGTKRFRIDPENTESGERTISIPLIITDVRLSDNGTYRCCLFDRQRIISSVTHSLVIPAAVENLTLTVHRSLPSNESRDDEDDEYDFRSTSSFEFEEHETTAVVCRSRGGNPRPQLRIFRGPDDLTDQFNVKVTERKVVGEVRGIEYLTTDLELSTGRFRTDLSHHRKQIRCVARIPGHVELDRSVTGLISVKYLPKLDCPKTRTAFLATANVKLRCVIRSYPLVRFDAIRWEIYYPNATNLTVGERHNGYRATATEEIHDDETVVLTTLTIEEVDESKFGFYCLWAKNEIGHQKSFIRLSEAIVEEPVMRLTSNPNLLLITIPLQATANGGGGGPSPPRPFVGPPSLLIILLLLLLTASAAAFDFPPLSPIL